MSAESPILWIDVKCPSCGVAPMVKCQRGHGTGPHRLRVLEAMKINRAGQAEAR